MRVTASVLGRVVEEGKPLDTVRPSVVFLNAPEGAVKVGDKVKITVVLEVLSVEGPDVRPMGE